jgi:hypothetical protein
MDISPIGQRRAAACGLAVDVMEHQTRAGWALLITLPLSASPLLLTIVAESKVGNVN